MKKTSPLYDVVLFDLDGTLVQGTVFIWKTLHDHFETDQERRSKAKKDFFAKRISYRRWFETDLELMGEKGVTRQEIIEVLRTKLWPTPGAHEVLARLRGEGMRLAVLSGSLDLVLSHFYPEGTFDIAHLNHMEFDGSGRLIGGTPTPYDLERKADGLLSVAEELGTTPDRCAFVGDNYNDLSAVEVSGLSIAFNPKSEELRKKAHVAVDDPDLRAILPHLMTGH